MTRNWTTQGTDTYFHLGVCQGMHVGLHASNSQACRAKLRGTNLKAKVQTLVLWTFRNHLCGLTYIDTTIHTNIHNTQYSHIHIDNHTYISTCLPTYVYNYINNKQKQYLLGNKHKYRNLWTFRYLFRSEIKLYLPY